MHQIHNDSEILLFSAMKTQYFIINPLNINELIILINYSLSLLYVIAYMTKEFNRIESHIIILRWNLFSHHDSEVKERLWHFACPVSFYQVRKKDNRVFLFINSCPYLIIVWSFNLPWFQKMTRIPCCWMSFQWVSIQWNSIVFEIDDDRRFFNIVCPIISAFFVPLF